MLAPQTLPADWDSGNLGHAASFWKVVLEIDRPSIGLGTVSRRGSGLATHDAVQYTGVKPSGTGGHFSGVLTCRSPNLPLSLGISQLAEIDLQQKTTKLGRCLNQTRCAWGSGIRTSGCWGALGKCAPSSNATKIWSRPATTGR
jgi:hypothetical protein